MKVFREKLQNIPLRRFMQILIALSLLAILMVQVFYYAQFSHLTETRTQSYADDILNQVSGQLDLYVHNIMNGAEKIAFNQHIQEFLTTSDMERKFIELSPFVQDYLEYVTSFNQHIQDIILLDKNGSIVTSVMPVEIQFLQDLQKTYDFSAGNIQTPFFTAAIENQGGWYQAYLMPIISAREGGYFFSQIGYCIVVSRTDIMNKLVLDISLAPNSHFFITDSNDRIIASNTESDIGKFYQSSFPAVPSGRKMMQEKHIENTDLSIYSYVSADDLTNDMIPTLRNGLLISVLSVLLLLIANSLFMSAIMKNVNKLLDFLRSMKSMGEIHQRVNLQSKNEIGLIANNVDKMLDQLDCMTHEILETQSKLYTAEIRQKQMELSMLQSQINPHFLYNTLNCMAGIGLAYQVPEIVTIASAMSKIFRYCIKGADLVEVRQEVACVEDYLKIMDIRYQEKFSYTIMVDPDILEMEIPKMLLQPIVENALYHGIELKRGKSLLAISGRTEENAILFTVQDDGKGMPPAALAQLQAGLEQVSDNEEVSRKSIGLRNIHSRIQLLYGTEYGLTISSEENRGTTVRIRLPCT
ncbi:MAG: histidine kinase [Provencibacterium sp.]|nr:histidine kinase [Provencibacterium sp.]